jgi:hypothetical protein
MLPKRGRSAGLQEDMFGQNVTFRMCSLWYAGLRFTASPDGCRGLVRIEMVRMGVSDRRCHTPLRPVCF